MSLFIYQKLKIFFSSDLRFFLVLSIITAALTSLPLLKNIHNWGAQDWDQHFAYAEAARKTILEYGQVPLWNMFRCGGMSEIGNSQNIFLSPFFLIILIFGVVLGYKLLFFIHLTIGIFGMCLLGRHFSLSKKAAYLTGIMYCCSGLFIAPYSSGMTNFLNVAWIPWITLFFLRSTTKNESHKYLVLIGLIMTNMFFFSFHYIALVFIYLCVLTLISLIQERKFFVIKKLFIIGLVFLGLSSVKLLPTIDMMHKYPRYIDITDDSGYSLFSLIFSLLSRNQKLSDFYINSDIINPFINTFSYGLDENGMYIGILGLLLFLIGVLKNKNIPKLYLCLITFFLFLSFGSNFPFNLFGFLHNFPILNMMRVPQRYKFFLMIFVCLFIGQGLDSITETLKKYVALKIAFTVSICILLVITVDLGLVYFQPMSQIFKIEPIYLKNTEFKQGGPPDLLTQINFGKQTELESSWSNEYPLIQANSGTNAACYEPIPVPKGHVHNFDQENYQGEVYSSLIAESVKIKALTPNYISVEVNEKSQESRHLIINQNFDSDWWIRRENGQFVRAQVYNSLLSTEVGPGEKKIQFFYLPLSFLIGLAISLLSLGILTYLFLLNSSTFKTLRN